MFINKKVMIQCDKCGGNPSYLLRCQQCGKERFNIKKYKSDDMPSFVDGYYRAKCRSCGWTFDEYTDKCIIPQCNSSSIIICGHID